MTYLKKPEWIRSRFRSDLKFAQTGKIIEQQGLHTICTSGRCPNKAECWNKGTATLMILGDICTRSCKFCNTLTGKPLPPCTDEPQKIAEAVRAMNLKHVVITSVDRDDLPDKGAAHWAKTICAVKNTNPATTVEVLIPDFDGNTELLQLIVNEQPDVISHNLETVQRLTPLVRSRAKYETSLNVLRYLSENQCKTKTGIMLGLGETETEIVELMDDALAAGVQILTIGQYLQPSRKNIAVAEYVTPEKFAEYRKIGLQKGFRIVESAPFVRSSYCAERHV
ncbi:lipoyl synthase [Bacteroidia bacterium]|nr:lipoyl synthase [Bacteroidia bacterium]GHV43161.1 lipoyl synthase [Bacteroidia bacterium]